MKRARDSVSATTTPPLVRLATQADAAALRSLLRQSWAPLFDAATGHPDAEARARTVHYFDHVFLALYDNVAAMHADDDVARTWVAEVDGVVAGTVTMTRLSPLTAEVRCHECTQRFVT